MKNQLILGACLAVTGFFLGFLPQYFRLNDARSDAASLTGQLTAEKKVRRIADFRNRAAQLYLEVENRNFASAGEQASKLFTDLRQFTNQAEEPIRGQLENVLQGRDAIIAAIAKADANAATLIRQVFQQLQQV